MSVSLDRQPTACLSVQLSVLTSEALCLMFVIMCRCVSTSVKNLCVYLGVTPKGRLQQVGKLRVTVWDMQSIRTKSHKHLEAEKQTISYKGPVVLSYYSPALRHSVIY